MRASRYAPTKQVRPHVGQKNKMNPDFCGTTWRISTIALACALLLAACDRTPPAGSPPAAAAVAPAVDVPGIAGAIDGQRAMAFVYGPVDPKLDAAVWTARGIAKSGPASSVLDDGDEALVSIRLAKGAKEGDSERFYLGVAMVPKRDANEESFDCETCAPVVGATVFVKRGERWEVEAHDPSITTMGQTGVSGEMSLVAIGPARNGILAKSSWRNRGNSGTYTALWTVEAGKIAHRLGVQVAADNAGNCSNDAKDTDQTERCQAYSLAMTFEPGPLPDRYDIRLRPSDPAWQYDDNNGKGEKLLRFDGQRYAAVETAATPASTTGSTDTVNRSSWNGMVPGADPVELLKAFIQADAWGLQTGGQWPLVTQFTTWVDGPGWDSSAVVESAEIVDQRDLGGKMAITVRMRKLGDLGTDGVGMPQLDTSTAGVVTRRFVLADVRDAGAKEARWKIVEPQDGPHLTAGYVLSVLLPRWCGKRDCTNTAAFRTLSARQAACAPSAIPLNRSCAARTK